MAMVARNTFPAGSPFLKWVGGKAGLLEQIVPLLPRFSGSYHEPFLGGGAVFFRVGHARRAFLSDCNSELIDCYRAVQADVEAVIAALSSSRFVYGETPYYAVRALTPESLPPAERAARFIYLNKCGFNGLYRVNSKGKFNVPIGRFTGSPNFCDADGLRSAATTLGDATISCEPFEAMRRAKKGDLVYCDPPYDPLTATANFTSYTKNGFTRDDQRQLCDLCTDLKRRGVHVAVSNSSTPFINALYREAGFTLHPIWARRNINANPDRRGAVEEILAVS